MNHNNEQMEAAEIDATPRIVITADRYYFFPKSGLQITLEKSHIACILKLQDALAADGAIESGDDSIESFLSHLRGVQKRLRDKVEFSGIENPTEEDVRRLFREETKNEHLIEMMIALWRNSDI